MRLAAVSFVLATTAIIGVATPLLAQDKTGINSSVASTASGPPGGAMTLVMAQELYAIGLARKDALTVLTAARLAASVAVREGDVAAIEAGRVDLAAIAHTPLARQAAPSPPKAPTPIVQAPETEAGVGKVALFAATSDEDGASAAPVDAATMRVSARQLAGEDETLLGLIDTTEAEDARGQIGGAISRLSPLSAGMTDVWEVPFYGSSPAELAVVGDGDANLDVLVTDENGHTICQEVGSADVMICKFLPAWNGYFYVIVQNSGSARNSYVLLTN